VEDGIRDIFVRVGAPYENVLPERREDVRDLVGHLNRIHPTKLEIVEYVPGRRGLPWAETVSIWIGTNLASGVAGAVASDVYEVAKRWARNRFRRKQEEKPGVRVRSQRFVIYGQDGKKLCEWIIDEKGEREE
jgi:hypothetical protein